MTFTSIKRSFCADIFVYVLQTTVFILSVIIFALALKAGKDYNKSSQIMSDIDLNWSTQYIESIYFSSNKDCGEDEPLFR